MRVFLNSLIICLTSLWLWSCKEQADHTVDCRQDTIIYDQYINNGLKFSIRIPLFWDSIPQSESDTWDAIGKQVIGQSKQIIPEHNLIALQRNRDSTKSILKVTCVTQEAFPTLRNARQFTEHIKRALDSSFSRIGIASHSKIARRETPAADFESLKMYFYKPTGGVFHTEMLYLYRYGHIITVTLGYGNEADSLELYKSLETLKFTQ